MRCEDLREKLTTYLDGETPANDTEACDAHIAKCDACAGLVSAKREERDRWRLALGGEAPDDLRREILAGRPRSKVIRLPRKHTGRKSMWPAWAAAAVLAVILVGQVVVRWGGSGRPDDHGDAFIRPGAVALIIDGETIGVFTELDEETLVLEGGFL